MRLRRLSLEDFRSQPRLDINFINDEVAEASSPTIRFFVGANGSGKSNTLEMLGLVFSQLANRVPCDFQFELEYDLQGQRIHIEKRHQRAAETPVIAELGITVKVRPCEGAEEWRYLDSWDVANSLLPDCVVGYSTGPTSGMRWALEQAVAEWASDQLSSTDAPEELRTRVRQHLDSPRTLFVGTADAQYAALALLAQDAWDLPNRKRYWELRNNVLRRMQVVEFPPLDDDSGKSPSPVPPMPAFSLRIDKSKRAALSASRQEMLDTLLRHATVERVHSMGARQASAAKPSEPVEEDSEVLAVFDAGPTRQQAIGSWAATPLELFEALLAWHRAGVLRDVFLVLRKIDLPDLLSSSEMSDGEFLYLGRYALLLLLQQRADCLLLLDEPETHFNDRWKVELISDIRTYLSPVPESAHPHDSGHEVLIATHSALALTDAHPHQVYCFERNEREGGVVVVQPAISTFAAGLTEIQNAVFKTREAIGSYARQTIERALQRGDLDELQRLLSGFTGPGLSRFYLRDRFLELSARRELP